MSLWIILTVLQRLEKCIFKTKLRLILQSTPKKKNVKELDFILVVTPPSCTSPGGRTSHKPFRAGRVSAPGSQLLDSKDQLRQWERTDQRNRQSSVINLTLFGIAKLIPFDVYDFSIWQMFKFTPQRIQSYPRHTHKNHFSVTHLHFFDKTVKDTIIEKKSPTRYVIRKLSRTFHLKILSKNIFTEPAVNGKIW